MAGNYKNIDSLLKPFQRFGVHLGLERIQHLLATLGNPHQRVPIIHVAGTNGKGSVCAYLSSVLTEAGYKVGRYISPHLIDSTERICLNENPIASDVLIDILQYIQTVIDPRLESPTQFEVITAAAWWYFAQSEVDIAVMEVGLGGRLDATNVCDRPLGSIITSISREHWQNLGPTVADIAREKAGILKPHCPAIIGELPPEAQTVVQQRIQALNCPAIWVTPAQKMGEGWASYNGINYPLPLAGEFQLMNSAIAIATLQNLQQQGWNLTDNIMQTGMSKTRWLGRLQWVTWNHRSLLIDGAHNPAAASGLRQYVDTLDKSIIWVMGMLSTKDHEDIFKALLRPGEKLYLVPVPDHSSANPEILATVAKKVCPELKDIQTFPELFLALNATINNYQESLIVLCGSLYLVGYFLQQIQKLTL